MKVISVAHLKKYYRVYRRSSGVLATLRSLFDRPYETVKAVDDISFSIGQGELVGFIGPNGAGKTTTLKCLSGLLYPSFGEISVFGFKPFERKSEYLKKISLVMGQKNQLWWDLPAMDTFLLNKEIYDVKDNDFKNTLDELINLLEVADIINQPVRQLSLGQRMKCELIAALLHKPSVLFLDEPTIGLDVLMQKKMRDFITAYNKKYKSTIILTSHYMADVASLCKRVIVINNGKLLYDGSLGKLVEEYAGNKIITVEFEKSVPCKYLSRLGKVESFEDQRVVLSVPKHKAKDIATTILAMCRIKDLNIEDPEIEEVIRSVFDKKRK